MNIRKIDIWGVRVGNFIHRMSGRYRRVVQENLRKSFPEWSSDHVDKVVRDVFRQFGRGALEFFHLLNLSHDQVNDWVRMEGAEHMDKALADGKGAIIVTAHYGNWELFARKLVLCGYPINVIARDSDDPGMTGIANMIRENAGYRVLSRNGSALPALRRLKKNEVLGILPDQNSYSGIMVDFFGRPAFTATGPAVFSLKTGAPIVCGFAHREPDGGFLMKIYPPLEVALTGTEEEDIRRITQALNLAIENEIRKDPAQWLWLHERWRLAERVLASRTESEE